MDENEVIEKLNNEFYKMKIENNVSKNKVSGTYFEAGIVRVMSRSAHSWHCSDP